MRAFGRPSMRPRPRSKGASSTRTIGASPLDGAIASTRAPAVQRRPNRSSAAIASLASGIESRTLMSCDRKPCMPARPSASATRSIRVRQPRPPRSSSPGRRLHRDVEVELGQPLQLLGQDGLLPGALTRQRRRARALPRRRRRDRPPARRTRRGRATRRGSRRRRRARTSRCRRSPSAGPGPARRAACAGRRRRAPRAAPRSAHRGRRARSRARRGRRGACRVSSHAERYPGPGPRAPSAPRSRPAATARTRPRRRA